MSIANSRLQQLRRPKVTRLVEGRLRVERWFKILHADDTHADKLTADIFGGYGLLDGSTGSAFGKTERPQTAYADCRLISEVVEEQIDRGGRKWHQLYQVYETLTATWALEDADKPGSTESGLRTLERSQVAIPGWDFATSDGVDDKLINADCSALGATNTYYLTGQVRPNAVTTIAVTYDGATSLLTSGLTADVWQEFQTAEFTGTPSNIICGFEGLDFSAADWHDVKLINATTGEVVGRWLDGNIIQGSLNGTTAADSSGNGYDGTHTGGTGGTYPAPPYDEDDVGVATIPDAGKTLYLAGFDDDSDDRRGRFITKWAEAGLLDVSETAGPATMPGSRRYTYTSQGLPYYPDTSLNPTATATAIADTRGKLETNSDGNYEGFRRYVRSWLVQKNGTTLTGIKYEGWDVTNVQVPGTVELTTQQVTSGGESGTIAIANEDPRKSKRVDVKVTIQIVTAPPAKVALAYDLGQISCSVLFTQASLRVGPGATATATDGNTSSTRTGFVKSFGISARPKTYEGCYLIGATTVTGIVSYVAVSTPEADGNVIVSKEVSSSVETKATGTGSTAATGYSETGIIRQKPRPILTTEDGTTYYEVVTWETI